MPTAAELLAEIDAAERQVAELWRVIHRQLIEVGQLGEPSRQISIARTELEAGFSRLRRGVINSPTIWEVHQTSSGAAGAKEI